MLDPGIFVISPGVGGGGGSRLGNTKTLSLEKLDVQAKMLFKHKERPWEVQSPV